MTNHMPFRRCHAGESPTNDTRTCVFDGTTGPSRGGTVGLQSCTDPCSASAAVAVARVHRRPATMGNGFQLAMASNLPQVFHDS